ncbi:LADA_0G10198g1_1 [Lachancea dasiensis]|uniref:LADA_0G10198g1_1 n=1 Tax=Lachancea dasiensis TaxID=1072105 RepID=A0A1G4JUM8_9SACH|nr:LADA_0G10198g1_1 [Lachancea dasiensis]
MAEKESHHIYQHFLQAPKLTQHEFPPWAENPATENEKDSPSTPPKLEIQQFTSGEMSMLPTPLVYTPSSPNMATRSPLESSAPNAAPSLPPTNGGRPKKSYGSLKSPPVETFNRSNVLEDMQRMSSEYPPHSALALATASSRSQRIASLSGVDRTLHTVDVPSLSNIPESHTPDSLSPSTDEYLTAYLIHDGPETLKLRKVKQVGVGNFSDVFLYEAVDSRPTDVKEFAVKHVKYPEPLVTSVSPKSPKYREVLSRVERSLTREIEALVGISHPCIIDLVAINDLTFVNSSRPLSSGDATGVLPPCDMIMSYCAGGDLFEMASQKVMPAWLLRRIFTELTLAVKYLHEKLVVHRDLKLENVLLKYPFDRLIVMNEQGLLASHHIVELADFGLCRRIQPDELCTTRCGSEDYVSPEILMGVPYDGRLSDTWALGVILYALLEERLPFDPLPSPIPGKRQRRSSVAHRISRFEWRWLKMADADNLPSKQIVEGCLSRKNLRWNIQQIYENSYVNDTVNTLKFAA